MVPASLLTSNYSVELEWSVVEDHRLAWRQTGSSRFVRPVL